MKDSKLTDRLSYLAEKFDIFDSSSTESISEKLSQLSEDGYTSDIIKTSNNTVLALVSSKLKNSEKKYLLTKISVCSDVFAAMIVADPSENKMYLQWMLNVFTRFLNHGNVFKDKESYENAIRFVDEDLPQAQLYLQLFEENKRKRKFLDLCKSSYSLIHVSDPTNINQYKSLAQLFDAIDPFIEREPSAVERTLKKFVDSGQALIPVKDRRFTLYIPKTTAASVVFSSFANWCTAREGNGMFNSYTTNHKKPSGQNSDIYIIIDNKFFTGESQNLFQIHFETGQIKDKSNGQNVSIFEEVLSQSEGVSNFFYEELMNMAKGFKKGVENNKYLDYLIQFGFAESLFELIDVNTPTMKFMTREIPRLPDISRFKNLDQLIICDAKMVEVHPSIGDLNKLELLVLTNNQIKTLPKEIGNLQKLNFLNLYGNPINSIPEEIAKLDKSNGGSLYRLAAKVDDIGEENFKRLKELLPTTDVS
jgi:hypothetical protein